MKKVVKEKVKKEVKKEVVKEKVKTNILIAWRFIKAIINVEDERFQKVKSEKLPGFHAYR